MTSLLTACQTRAVLALTGLCVTIGSLGVGASPANAVSEFRQQLPIQAGTQLNVPGGSCTAGAVLASTSLLSGLTTYLRSVRYVVTARHCASDGARVSVGTQGVVGSVIWHSNSADIEIVKIEPLARRGWQCDPSSVIHRCAVSVYYTPRAIGNIFLRDQAGRYRSIPVRGTAIPGAEENFCTSGAVTGVNCTWTAAELPVGHNSFQAGARTWADNVSRGDSGGPVAGRDGQLYGIINQFGLPDSPVPDLMTYAPIAQIFSEQPGYELAGSG